ncbi:MAG: hypothetical protein R2750_11975 [Bacteroidales bacterium]
MINYKPYSFLVKKETTLTICFVVRLPAGNNLSAPSKLVTESTTTLTYEVISDPTLPAAWQVERDYEIEWDGRDHKIKVVIGSGSGTDGGTSETSSTLEFD